MKIAINFIDVSKYFKVYYDKSYSLKESLLNVNRKRYVKNQVLSNISFRIMEGETVALVGANGSGKSTILKMISGILFPSSGDINNNGKIASLLELGAGFHPDFTGIENISFNASIFGLNSKDIASRVDKIIEFSELGDFINAPVRTYSSGMYMRLAFSIAINVDADIILIDEILAVGDIHFQNKCFSKLLELKKSGKTIVIVSHDLNSILMLCDRSIWIKEGIINMDGKSEDIINQYKQECQ